MPASTKPAAARAGAPGPAVSGPPAELALRIGGVAVAVALALTSAFWESVLTSWYVMDGGHQVRLPAAPIAAVACNAALIWFVRRVTGKVAFAVLPGIAWFVVIFLASSLTAEGDLIIIGNWVGILTLLLGTLTWAGGAYLVIIRSRRRILPAGPVPPQKLAAVRQAPPPKAAGRPAQAAKQPGRRAAGPKPPGPKPAGPKPPGANPAGPKPAGGTGSTSRGRR